MWTHIQKNNIIQTEQVTFKVTYVYLYTYRHICNNNFKKEATHLKGSKKVYIGEFDWRKEKQEMKYL